MTRRWSPFDTVYIARRTGDGAIKIGFSQNPYVRIREMGYGRGWKAEALAVFPGDRARERQLHHRFAAAAIRGEPEWFRPVPELLGFVAWLQNATDPSACREEIAGRAPIGQCVTRARCVERAQ